MEIIILLLFCLFGYGGWCLAVSLFDLFFGKPEPKETIIFKTVNYHTHHHKNISIIDEQTKQKILNLKE